MHIACGRGTSKARFDIEPPKHKPTMTEEIFEIVDEDNNIIGTAKRSDCHGNPSLIHRTAHVIVYHPDGRMLLQKRTMNKDVQPGKWDTTVGGHLDPGENFEQGARREMNEELGIPLDVPLKHVFDSKIRNDIESENVRIFSTIYSGTLKPDPEEIEKIKFWKINELCLAVKQTPEIFTPNLIKELRTVLSGL